MVSKAVIQALESMVSKENIHLQEPLSKHTTFRVGGPADCLVEIEDVEQLKKVKKYLLLTGVDHMLIGNGSNLLAGDGGYRGVILQMGSKMAHIRVEGNTIIAGAGALLSRVARVALEHGLTGLEFASGIPGSVGGAVVMNAGAYGGEMMQIVSAVRVLHPDGEEMLLLNSDMEFGYRTSVIKKHPFAVVEVIMELKPGDPKAIQSYMEDLAGRRREKQPLEYPSAGSTFKRPEGYFAGELIMKAGMRGFGIGGAQVSEKHCGFVINAANATARDIMSVITAVQTKVREQFGVDLEPEVITFGDF